MDMQEMMRQAQVMQQRMQALQEELAVKTVSAESGGGLVKVTMTCKGEVQTCTISPDIVNPDDVETLQDLIIAAMNAARDNADRKLAEETQAMMQQLGLPSDIDLSGVTE